jgi:exopolysaccharide biosynthesis glucuronosyltransferase PssE
LIFVTVGGQKPFPRLIDCVDTWASNRTLPPSEVLAQIGKAPTQPGYIESVESLTPPEYTKRFQEASVVLAHAGMGTILTAVDLEKPILVMPRRASQGEHRNDHQLATARQLQEVLGLCVAWDEHELRDWLDRLHEVRPSRSDGASRAQLVSFIKNFVEV